MKTYTKKFESKKSNLKQSLKKYCIYDAILQITAKIHIYIVAFFVKLKNI